MAGRRRRGRGGLLGCRIVIFVSVGSMLPFERLIRAVDLWACDNPDQPIYAQIGDTEYEPRHAPFTRMMPMTEYRDRLRTCDLFVAHVGMGSILQALEMRKPMLLLPRLHALGEHTTDHQVHTAARFRGLKGLTTVDDVPALHVQMTALLRAPPETGDAITNTASAELLDNVTSFLASVRRASEIGK